MTLWEKRQKRATEQEAKFEKVRVEAEKDLKLITPALFCKEQEWTDELIEKGEVELITKDFSIPTTTEIWERLLRIRYDDDDRLHFLKGVVYFIKNRDGIINVIHADDEYVEKYIKPYLLNIDIILEKDEVRTPEVVGTAYRLTILERRSEEG